VVIVKSVAEKFKKVDWDYLDLSSSELESIISSLICICMSSRSSCERFSSMTRKTDISRKNRGPRPTL